MLRCIVYTATMPEMQQQESALLFQPPTHPLPRLQNLRAEFQEC